MADLAQQFGENTLDEPVSETILRDVRLVARRLALVVMPGISSVRRPRRPRPRRARARPPR